MANKLMTRMELWESVVRACHPRWLADRVDEDVWAMEWRYLCESADWYWHG